MRIAYLSFANFDSRAANVVHVMKMCAGFSRAGHEVVLFGRGNPLNSAELAKRFGVKRDAYEIAAVAAPELPILGGGIFALRTARRVRAGRLPDLCYARHALSLAAVASTGVPMVLEVHAPPVRAHVRLLEHWVVRQPNFLRLVTVSGALSNYYEGQYPWLQDRIISAHDAADPSPAPLRPPDADGPFKVGYVGHLYEGRGIEIIKALVPQFHDIDFHIVGGEDSDRQRLWPEGAPPNLVLHGHVPHAEVPEYLSRFDVVLAPYQERVLDSGSNDTSRWMSPLKVFEYMAAGRPMIASDLPVLHEVLDAGRNALIVPPADIGAWVAALRSLRSDRTLRESLGVHARQDHERRFTWSARAQRVLEGLPEEMSRTSGR